MRNGMRTPKLVLVPASDAFGCLRRYVGVLDASALVGRPSRAVATWWERPIVLRLGSSVLPGRPIPNSQFLGSAA